MNDNEITAGVESFLASEKQTKITTLRNNFVNSSGVSPDDFAKQIALSKATQIPIQSLLADPEEAKRHGALASTNFSGLVTDTPLTADFLTNPKHAGVSRDDTSSLGAMEGVLTAANYFGGSMVAGVHDLVGAGAKLTSALLPFTTSDQDLAVLYKDDPEGLRRMRNNSLATTLDRFARKQTQRSERTMEEVTPLAKATYGELEYATTDTSNAAYLSPVKMVSDVVRSLPTTAALFVTTLLTRGAAARAEQSALAAGLTTAEARAAATKAATDVAVKFGATSEGGIGYAQQATQTQAEVEKASEAKLLASPEYTALLANGYDPLAARVYLAARAGETAGVGAGFADAVTNAIGGRFLGKLISEGGTVLPRIGKGFANEALVEGVQSPLEQWFQNVAVQANLDPNKDLSEGLLESTIQGLLIGGLTGGAFSGILGRAAEAQQAQTDAKSIADLFSAAASSLTGKRSPDTLGQFLDHAAPDATVLIDPDKLQEILAQSGVDIRTLPSAEEQLQSGDVLGAGIEIPISELITGLSGTSAEASIIPHLRTGADSPTLAETQEYETSAAAFFQKEAERILEQESKNEDFLTAARAVQDDLYNQLMAVGRHGPQVNQGYAKLGGAFYSVLASDLGVTPAQVRDGWTDANGTTHRGYKLTIGGEGTTAPKLGQPSAPVVNIGLDLPSGGRNTPQQVVEALRSVGVQVTTSAVHQSDTEATVVAHLDRPLTPEEAHSVSVALGQEAIVQHYQGQGELYGPEKDKWGAFNPEYFLTLSGQRLSEAESLAQAQSSRRPTSKRAPEDHLGEVPLTVDYTKIEPEKNAQNMALVAKYPGLRFKARDPAKRVEEFIQHVTGNLLWLHDQIPAEIRQRSKLWYDGARLITERWAQKYGKTDAQVAAVLAVYSPQKDWFMNVSLAERTLDIVQNQQQTPWDSVMSSTADTVLGNEKFALLRSRIEGKSLGELTDKLDQAAWVRIYDEAHNNRAHRLVTPEGGFKGYAQTVKDNDAKTGWPGFATIVKALYIMEDGSASTIDQALGGEHKVRSFYNNIYHPTSDQGFVTIDTHAVAAGLLRPLSGNSTEVAHNFGSEGTARSAATGMAGTYPYYQEAYRRAAEARGLLPREMQSITWEAVRELYTMGFKHDTKKLTALDNLWTAYEKGHPIPDAESAEKTSSIPDRGTADKPDRASSLDAVRRNILKLAGGVERPAWVEGDSGLSPAGWASTYTDELLGRSFSERERTAGAGDRVPAPGSSSKLLSQSTPLARAGTVSAPVVGVHFSRQVRPVLNSSMFGTGLPGGELARLANTNDTRIKNRIAFYIDAGTGVYPEAGVGGAAHVATLTNLYDADADTLKIFRQNQRDMNAAESAIVDAGFDGYLQRKNFTNQGTAVLLGERVVEAEHVGTREDANARATVPPPADIPAMKTAAIQLVSDTTLPGGALLPREWKAELEKQKSPLAAMIDFDQFDPDARLYKDELSRALWQTSETWYYSQLTRAIENASDKIFTTGTSVRQWLVANAGKLGVKKEELEFTGITDWLDLQPRVSKADVVAFMAQGGVKVEEVVLGKSPKIGTVTQALDYLAESKGISTAEVMDTYGYTSAEDYISLANDLRGQEGGAGGETKFQAYVLPGGDNYRELLITLPTTTATDHLRRMELAGLDRQRPLTASEQAEYDQLTSDKSLSRQNFKSSHFDQPNILAHVRMNERTDADGARVLFVEEVQSDWGQQGKKTGFAQKPEIREEKMDGATVFAVYIGGRRQMSYVDRAVAEAFANEQPQKVVPLAPFVQDTKGWTALAVKRVLAYAAEKGFDKVAWTTGAQQADRYDLSKQVSGISYRNAKNGEGYEVQVIGDKANTIWSSTRATASELEDVIGKEITKKIADGAKAEWGNLSGLDLKVGGEGMLAYYDKILPQVVNDVLKKVGGGKIENVQLKADAFQNAQDDALLAELGATPEGARPQYQPGFTITPAMRESVSKGLPLFQAPEAPKLGSFSPQTLDLRLLADANYTTFVHELGHFFLTVYADVASQPDAPQRVVDGMNAVLTQFGISDVATWNAMSLEQQRPYHERLAESFEQYIFTGKAPSLELQSLFSSMLAWFKRVYTSIKDFVDTHPEAKLNPELSAVFDRMLASDAEIASANAARGYAALFANAAEAGMSDKDFAAYTGLTDAQREDAESILRTRSLRDMKWLQARRNKIIAEMQADAKEKRAEVRKAIASDVRQEPIRQAERYLKHGVVLSETGADIAPLGANKLQISEVKSLYPEEALTPPPDWKKLGYGKYGLLAEAGLSPYEVAERFGIESGPDLISQLIGLPPINDEIEALTDQRMLEQYGDLSSPAAMATAADEAIHNNFRTRAVATELAALAKNIGSPAVLIKAAKEYARQILETKTSKTLKPWGYAAAETRAGKAALAALRKGDRAKAATEKRTELVNHVTAKEAYVVEKEISKIIARFKKIVAYNNESSAVKARDFATVQAVRAILGSHGIGAKGDAAVTYLETVEKNDPAAASRLKDILAVTSDQPRPWEEIQVSDLRELSEAINDIWFSAARVRQMEVQGKLVAQEQVAGELLITLQEQGIPTRVPGEGYAPTKMEKLGMKFGAAKAVLRRMEFVANVLDGQRQIGPWLRNIVSVIQDATSAMNIAKASSLKQYEALLNTIRPSLARGEIAAPELGYTFGKGPSGSGKAELLHAILHTGNESNMRKMLLGRNWATVTQNGALVTPKWDIFVARMIREGHLTGADYAFTQGVWDLMDSLKPAAQQAHRAVFGKYFSEVTANAFTNQFGTFAGGYVPALTDSDIVKDNEIRKLRDEAFNGMELSFPAPMKGFTNARAENYTRELKLDLASLSSHISQVLLFSYMAVPVADVQRVLARPEVSGALNRLYPSMLKATIIPWLNRVSKNSTSSTSADFVGLGNFLRTARSRAGVNTMMGSLSNSIQQLVGIVPASVAIEGTYLRRSVVDNLTSPSQTAEYVKGLSDYMRTRMDNEAYAALDNIEQILINPSVYESVVALTRRHAYFMQTAVDNFLSPTIWMAAYNQAKDKTPDIAEKDAVHIADSIIRQTQGASGAADVATFEAGHPFMQLFTQFTGYFNMMAQFLHGQFVKNVASEVSLPKKYARAFYIVGIGFYAQAVAAELVSMLFRGGPEDDDADGTTIDEWLFQLGVMAPTKFVTATVPFLGTALQVSINKWNTKPYDDKMMNSPAISTLEQGLGAPVATYKAVFEEGKPSTAIRGFAGIIGLFTGLPTALAARPVGYLADVGAGKVTPTSGLDLARGIITGTASPESKK